MTTQTARQAPVTGTSHFPDFPRSLPMALMRAREAVMKKFVPILQKHDLTAQQWRVMRALNEEDGLDVSQLSQRCFLLKPSLSRIVQHLVRKRIIVRTQDSKDQRRYALSLTRTGRDLFADILPHSEERYAQISQIFGYGKLQLLHELLEELTTKLGADDEAAGET